MYTKIAGKRGISYFNSIKIVSMGMFSPAPVKPHVGKLERYFNVGTLYCRRVGHVVPAPVSHEPAVAYRVDFACEGGETHLSQCHMNHLSKHYSYLWYSCPGLININCAPCLPTGKVQCYTYLLSQAIPT